MKTDRELLELAAKAAGLDFDGNIVRHRYSSVVWNPLTDDGDALRLAVKLGITTEHSGDTAWAYAIGHDANVDEYYGSDPCAATRRAIARAAAQIGAAKCRA